MIENSSTPRYSTPTLKKSQPPVTTRSPRKPRTPANGSDARREELLALGGRLFGNQPYSAVGIEDIAREAGVAKGLLYYYFGDKRGFYVATVQRAAEELFAAAAPDPDLPALQRLLRALDAYLRFAEERPEVFRTVILGHADADPDVRAIYEAGRQMLISEAAEGLFGTRNPSPVLRAAMAGFAGLLEGLTEHWQQDQELEREQIVQLVIAALPAIFSAAQSVDPTIQIDPEVSALLSAAPE